MTSAVDASGARARERLERLWVLFALTWAAAVLLHFAGSPRVAPAWGRALAGAAAVAVLARPRSRPAVAALAVAVVTGAWLEAPRASNHWLLHALVALVVLGGLAARPASVGDLGARIGGPLRALLLAFYAFAAFAKLTVDFFDPAVSCAGFLLDASARSWGLGGLVEGWVGTNRALPVVAATVELSIPVLLLVHRTRSLGVLVALAFHFVLALDRAHPYFDFSAVLATLFLLFLPPDGVVSALTRLGAVASALRARWSSGPELLRLFALAGAALVVVVAAGPDQWPARPLLRGVGSTVWLVGGLGLLGFAIVAARTGTAPRALFPAGSARVLLIVPLLAVANGLTPYLELKTVASWNMYSNLAVVDRESNHLLVRRSLPLTEEHERLVQITAAEGVDLHFYIGSQWRLPEVALVDHLADRPGAVVTGVLDGREVRYEGGQGGRSVWQRKLQAFRSVDVDGPVSCQALFGPAR